MMFLQQIQQGFSNIISQVKPEARPIAQLIESDFIGDQGNMV